MGNKIRVGVNELADTIANELGSYTKEVAKEVKKAVDKTAKELLKNIQADAPVRSGDYKKAMKTRKAVENDYNKEVEWYVEEPHYRLSHLLEHGHAKRGGGRTKAYPHIAKNEEKMKENLVERVREAIENAGK